MDQISTILRKILVGANLHQGVSNYQVFRMWNDLVGGHLAASTRPLRIAGDTLWVQVENATLGHHMTFLVPQLLRKIRETIPEAKINTIRFTTNPEP
jgi:hypothetical protein